MVGFNVIVIPFDPERLVRSLSRIGW